jgi:TonB family protein
MSRIHHAAALFLLLSGLVPVSAQVNVSRRPADYVPYDKAPEAIKQVQAVYPETAARDSVEGTVWIKSWIDETGKVVETKVQRSDNTVLNQSALDAIRQWTFKPAMMNGKPVAVWVSIPMRFKFSDRGHTQASGVSNTSKTKRYPPAEDAKHDMEPELISQVQPSYPPEAFQQGVEGKVWTKMWVDESGKVVEVIVTKSDNELFNQASMDAGLQWVFKPALANGKPVAVWITVPFQFKIAGY